MKIILALFAVLFLLGLITLGTMLLADIPQGYEDEEGYHDDR